MDKKEKMELASALLLMLLEKMTDVDFNGPEMVIVTNDNKKFHIVGYNIKKEDNEDGKTEEK